MSETISELREAIDSVDRSLIATLAARRGLVARLAALKSEHALSPVDPDRERDVRARWHAEATEQGVPIELVDALLEVLLRYSRAHVASVAARLSAE